MASTRGPLPKRDAERAGHKGPAAKADKVRMQEPVDAPPPRSSWEARTLDWYDALQRSVMAQFYEPSDWMHALMVGDLVDEFYGGSHEDGRPMSGEKLKQMFAELDKLGVTESSRRRLRVEGHRPGSDEDEDAPTPSGAVLDRFQKAANGGQ